MNKRSARRGRNLHIIKLFNITFIILLIAVFILCGVFIEFSITHYTFKASADWLEHFASFMILSFVSGFVVASPAKLILAISVFAVFIEAAQMLVPNRTPSLIDLLWSVSGILSGFGFSWLLLLKRRIRR